MSPIELSWTAKKKILGTDSNLMTMVIPPAMQPLKLIIPPTLKKKEARVNFFGRVKVETLISLYHGGSTCGKEEEGSKQCPPCARRS